MTTAYVNGYRQIASANFSLGLNLRDKADALQPGEAIDLLNVTFTEHGAIRQRDGFADLTPADLTNRVDSLAAYYTAAGVSQLIAGCGTRLEALNQVGAVLASQAGLGGGPWVFARFGDPTHEYMYAGNGIDPLLRWNGAAWTTGATLATVNGATGQAMPKAGAICVTAAAPGSTSGTNASNRLLVTGFGSQVGTFGGVPLTPSRVFMSNPGLPETFETDGDPGIPGTRAPRGRNYFDLVPGDGEKVMAAVTWRELTFIFKETKFFVLWGEGQLTDGTPTFQVREVVNNVGLSSSLGVNVGRDGVYFFNRRGVYRTSGGDPVLLSDKLAPLWTGDPEIYYQGEPINLAQLGLVRLLWTMEQVFVAVPTGSRTYNDRLLVYDTQHDWWSIYDIAASALASFRRQARSEVHHGYSTGPQRIGHREYGSTNDRGATIVSRWREGWLDYGTSIVKSVRETRLWGAGAAVVSLSTDFRPTQRFAVDTLFGPTGAAWTYAQLTARGGTYTNLKADYTTYAALAANTANTGTVEDALVRKAVRGYVFSTQLSNSPQKPSWALHRIARHLREVREASTTS